MRKHFLTFILLSLLGCKGEEKPEDILAVEKMASILVDVHLAEGKIEELKLRNDTAKVTLAFLENEIFDKHGVERDVYEKSFNYHLSDINSMDLIYSIVVDSLNLRRQLTKID